MKLARQIGTMLGFTKPQRHIHIHAHEFTERMLTGKGPSPGDLLGMLGFIMGWLPFSDFTNFALVLGFMCWIIHRLVTGVDCIRNIGNAVQAGRTMEAKLGIYLGANLDHVTAVRETRQTITHSHLMSKTSHLAANFPDLTHHTNKYKYI